MPRYMDTAAEANNLATTMFERFVHNPADYSAGEFAEDIARLVNYGMRCCPRAAQSTVRLNAVKRSVQGLPVKVTMEQKTNEHTGTSYHVLVTEPVR